MQPGFTIEKGHCLSKARGPSPRFPLHELVALSSFLAPFSIQLHLLRKPSVIPNFQRSTAQPKRPCQLVVMGRPRAGIVANSCHAEWVVFKFPLVQGNVISDGWVRENVHSWVVWHCALDKCRLEVRRY
jgi:hypothetical protein